MQHCTSNSFTLLNHAFVAYLRPTHSPSHLVTFYIEGFSHFVTSMTASIASGWSKSCRVGLSPTGKRRLSTEHTPSGQSIQIYEWQYIHGKQTVDFSAPTDAKGLELTLKTHNYLPNDDSPCHFSIRATDDLFRYVSFENYPFRINSSTSYFHAGRSRYSPGESRLSPVRS